MLKDREPCVMSDIDLSKGRQRYHRARLADQADANGEDRQRLIDVADASDADDPLASRRVHDKKNQKDEDPTTDPSYLFRFILKTILGWRFWSVAFCLLLALLDSTIALIDPTITGMLIDAVSNPKSLEHTMYLFNLWMACSLATSALGLVLGYTNSMVDTFIGLHTQYLVLTRFLYMDMSFFAHPLTEANSIPTRVSGDSSRFPFFIRDFPFHVILTLWGLAWTPVIASFTGILHWRMIFIGLWSQPFIAGLSFWGAHYNKFMEVEIGSIRSRISSTMIQIVRNVPFIKMHAAVHESIRVRQREQYVAYDYQRAVIQINIAIRVMTTGMGMLVTGYIWVTAIQAIFAGEMTYGQFQAFQRYLGQFQGKLASVYKMYTDYTKARGVIQNVVNMLATPITIDKDAARRPYRTERPREDEMPEMLGSDLSQTMRTVLRARQGTTRWRDYATAWLDGPTPYTAAQLPWNRPCVPPQLPHPQPWSIEFRNVHFRYPEWAEDPKRPNLYLLPRTPVPNELDILDNVNFLIQPSEMVVITGPNGCGKSTTLSLIMRLFDPRRGQVFINGTDARQMDVEHLRRMQGIMVQQPPLFMGSVVSNCYFGEYGDLVPKDEMERRKQFLDALRTAARVPLYMDLSEAVGKTRQLSGGQAQKIQMLRVLRRPYSLICFDEPTNNLDPQTQQCLFEWIQTIRNQRHQPGAYAPTIVIVSHDKSVLKYADRQIELPDTEHAKQQRDIQEKALQANMRMAAARLQTLTGKTSARPVSAAVAPAPQSAVDAVTSAMGWLASGLAPPTAAVKTA